MFKPMKSMGRLDQRILALEIATLIGGALVCLTLAGYFLVNTNLPANLYGDHLVTVTTAKSYINGHGFRYDSQLGYPDVRDSLYFPSFDLSYRIILWIMARITQNPFDSIHGLYVVGLSAMFGSGYATLRSFGVRRWMSVIGSLAYVLTPFLGHRGYGHDFLALSFSTPLGLGLALRLGAGQDTLRAGDFLRRPLTLVTLLVVGTSGLYYAFYSVMFVAFAGLARGLGRRQLAPVIVALVVTAVVFALVLFSGYGFDLPLVLSGKFAGPRRYAYEQVLYGISLQYAAIPFNGLQKVAQGIRDAMAAVPYAFNGEGAYEWPTYPLTATLLSTPFVAAICQSYAPTQDSAQRPWLRLIGMSALLVVFGLLFGAEGGIGFIFNLLISPEIRGDARLMPFLTFGAVVILCCAGELAASTGWRWLRLAGPTVVAVILVLSIQPTLWIFKATQTAALANPHQQAVRASVPRMLKAKTRADLRAILELPIARFPENPPIKDLNPYDLQLPYLFDDPHSPTRWSYGANENQRWFSIVDAMARQPSNLVARARSRGFDGVLIEKGGYEPSALKALQASIQAGVASDCRLYEDDVEVLYALVRSPSGKAC